MKSIFPGPLLDSIGAESKLGIVFEQRRCLRARLNTNTCSLCITHCQNRALTLSGRMVLHDAAKCTGCLCCAAVCPNDAFSHAFDLEALLKTLQENDDVLFSCTPPAVAPGRQSIPIPCVGLFSESLLVAMCLVAKGVISIDVRRCPGCGNGYALEYLSENLAAVAERLRDRDALRLKLLSENEALAPPREVSDRRSFLCFVRDALGDWSRAAYRNQEHAKDCPRFPTEKIPTRHLRAMQIALDRSNREGTEKKGILLAYYYSLRVNDRCDCCPACSGMCPTGALQRKEAAGEKHLVFTSARCSGCGLCRDFCKKGAQEVFRGFAGDPQNPLLLAGGERKCEDEKVLK